MTVPDRERTDVGAGSPEGSRGDGAAFGSLLLHLVAEVAREPSAASVASRIADVFVRTLGARAAWVYENEDERSPLRLRAIVDTAREGASGRFDAGDADALAERVALSGLVLVTHAETMQDSVEDDAAEDDEDVCVAFPLFAGNVTVGAVSALFARFPHVQRPEVGTLRHSLGALLGRARLQEHVVQLTQDARRHQDGTALVAHDLRQPLSTMLLTTSLLAKHVEPRNRPILAGLARSVLLFERMVADLNDVSLLVSGKFTLQLAPIDVVAVVTAAVSSYAPGANIRTEGYIPRVGADAQRIEQVLLNLLGNASKHGSAGAVPRVDVVHVDTEVVVSVTNRGGHIAEDERLRVFDPYYRARSSESPTPGLGLGLYICKTIVEEHGGRIWTDGDAEHTRFSFSLPVPTFSPESSQIRLRLGGDA